MGCIKIQGGSWGNYRSLMLDIMSDMYLKGLHGCNELGEGCDIDTTENLEVHEGYALKSVELIADVGFVAESTGSFFSGNI